ncbi:hypothetical protein PPN31114_00429 [Pandoraea pneumonica]|uniref:Uncharacterized protein n=1 Tax=Pandoraea pneumonica TaxID=2508299 RepID=A0A5E4RW45_9BURK|nr:hypothetical protein PPN31114_00429 [Pandoraea pneumonica]
MSHATPAAPIHTLPHPSQPATQTTKPPAKRSLRVPKRARLGDMPLLRRVGNELAYTPTRCRVMASGIPMRRNPWWERLPTAEALAAAAQAQRALAGKILPETSPNPTR